MPVITQDHPPVTVRAAPTYPRLMQHANTGMVYLVAQRVRGDATMYDAACIHSAPVPSVMPGFVPPPLPGVCHTIGDQIPGMDISNLRDYNNVVSLQNDD